MPCQPTSALPRGTSKAIDSMSLSLPPQNRSPIPLCSTHNTSSANEQATDPSCLRHPCYFPPGIYFSELISCCHFYLFYWGQCDADVLWGKAMKRSCWAEGSSFPQPCLGHCCPRQHGFNNVMYDLRDANSFCDSSRGGSCVHNEATLALLTCRVTKLLFPSNAKSCKLPNVQVHQYFQTTNRQAFLTGT